MAKILVVDDEREILSLLEIFLTKKGFQVVLCGEGDEAIKILEKDRSIDLVILDYKMPGLDGDAVLKELKSKQYKVPVIIITGSFEEEIRELEADAFLLKPIDLDELVDKINNLLRGRV